MSKLQFPSPSDNIHSIFLSHFGEGVHELSHLRIVVIFEQIKRFWIMVNKFACTHSDVFDGQCRVDIEFSEFLVGKILDEFFVEETVDRVLFFGTSLILIPQRKMKRGRIDTQFHDGMAPMSHHDMNASE